MVCAKEKKKTPKGYSNNLSYTVYILMYKSKYSFEHFLDTLNLKVSISYITYAYIIYTYLPSSV